MRGERLEALKEVDTDARDVDLDDGILAGCSELGLSAEIGGVIPR